jgi:cysteine desulfurase/selenocysteine lyase
MRSLYLDNAATTYPKPEPVYEAVESFMREVGGSAGRSGHARAVDAGRVVFEARSELAGLLGAADPLRLVFTKNATEALNIAIQGLVRQGDHVVTSSMEHNSVMRPLQAMKVAGARVSVVPCAPDGSLEPGELARAMTGTTRLVVLTGASNVTGTIMPVEDVAEITSKRGVPLLVDAAQTAGRLDIDIEGSGIDLLAFTGHKELFGPQGTGGLYVREGVDLEPLCFGGTGSRSTEMVQPRELPERFESGTLNAPGLAGLKAGVQFVKAAGLDAIREHEVELVRRLLEGLSRLPGVRSYGPSDAGKRIGIVPMTLGSMSPPEAAEVLDTRYGIATRAGLHCSPAAHRTVGTQETGALRVSFSWLNTTQDVEYLLECLGEMTGRDRSLLGR